MRIVLNRSDAIGDLLLTLPMAEWIKRHRPNASLAFVVSERCRPLLLNNPFIDEVWSFNPKDKPWVKWREIYSSFKRFDPTHYIHVGGDQIVSMAAWSCNIENRGGLLSKWPSFIWLNKGVRQKRSQCEFHESVYNLKLLNAFGLEAPTVPHNEISSTLFVSEIEKQQALKHAEEVYQLKLSQWDTICLHPGMTGHTLGLSPETYAQLILEIEKNYPNRYHFLITYTPADNQSIQDFQQYWKRLKKRELEDRVHLLDGSQIGLRDFMGVLSASQMLVSGSTGPLHISNALGIKQVGVFSPIAVQSPKRWGPYQRDPNRVRIIQPQVECPERFHCAGRRCPAYDCMQSIQVQEVMDATKSLLG